MERVLDGFGRLVTDHPDRVILITILLTAITSISIFSIKVNTDPINYYESDHPVAVSANLINTHLGGFFPVSVVFRGDIRDPALLKKIDLPGGGQYPEHRPCSAPDEPGTDR